MSTALWLLIFLDVTMSTNSPIASPTPKPTAAPTTYTYQQPVDPDGSTDLARGMIYIGVYLGIILGLMILTYLFIHPSILGKIAAWQERRAAKKQKEKDRKKL